jgi:large subunit ribosomal protein L7/L12
MRRSLLQLSARILCNQQSVAVSHAEPIAKQAVCWQQVCHTRTYSQPAHDDQQQQQNDDASEKVKQLAAEIMNLSVLECSQLSRVLRDKLGVPRGSGMPMMPMMAAGAPAAAAAPAAAEAPAEEKKEKTEFDVKLEGFSPEGKIKVIKEIRALTSLGLKEAKELVSITAVVSGVLLCLSKVSH